jgi:dienelactone hydrolase
MASNPPAKCCTVGVKHEGEPTGKMVKIASNIDAYLATPSGDNAHKDKAILYLPDILGIWQNAQLIADQYAANGYTTLLVDLFNGDPVPVNEFGKIDVMKWLAEGSDGKNPHTKEVVDGIVEAAIKHMKEEMGIKKIGAVGYCFGAKYVVRHYKDGIDVGFVAHPSFVDEDELAAITGPLSIAAAETDSIFPAEKRHKSEEILQKVGQPYQVVLYSQTSHGFAVRCDLSVRAQKWAKEQAFNQAVQWFDEYLQ